jgi:hypothetical protein
LGREPLGHRSPAPENVVDEHGRKSPAGLNAPFCQRAGEIDLTPQFLDDIIIGERVAHVAYYKHVG